MALSIATTISFTKDGSYLWVLIFPLFYAIFSSCYPVETTPVTNDLVNRFAPKPVCPNASRATALSTTASLYRHVWDPVSGPVVRPTDEIPTRCFTNGYLRIQQQRHWDDLKSIAQQELTLSIFHTIRSLIRLVFITSHLIYYSTMTSLDL